jgi:hypothetical protein
VIWRVFSSGDDDDDDDDGHWGGGVVVMVRAVAIFHFPFLMFSFFLTFLYPHTVDVVVMLSFLQESGSIEYAYDRLCYGLRPVCYA